MATVVVHARAEGGRRRAGRLWPGRPVVVDVDEATLALLRADPELRVREHRGETDEAAPVTSETIESLEARVAGLQAELAASRAAHDADADAMAKATAECEALRKQVAALEEAATAPTEKRSRK